MILVDSSAWIVYYRSEGSREIKGLIKKAISSDLVAVNGVIIVEVLSGISNEAEFKKVRSHFQGFHYLSLSENDFIEASLLGSSLRRKGVSVPPVDVMIAASAIRTKSRLYHLDGHFDLIARHAPLDGRNLLARRRIRS